MKIIVQALTIGLTAFVIFRMSKGTGCCGGKDTGNSNNSGECCSHGKKGDS